MKLRTVVVFSGGLDSTVLLWKIREEGRNVKALSFDYGQRHGARELDAARTLAALAGVDHDVVDLSGLRPLIAKGSQTGGEPVPQGHYEDASMRRTVVPNRNMILLAVAVGHAVTIGANIVAYGAHGGDHEVYPDCRPEFVAAMNAAAALADWTPVTINAPFLYKRKEDIVRLGNSLRAPLAETWSCYEGRLHHCGLCGTCVERREAFRDAGVPDPTVYEP